ncbi:hypothetical protein [Streptomyces sp900116325]|uniref:Uncharacterized protein n=1 Tax=Streptomyces sp. 900116325 TaxID=3154295 RepID=A0ABV2U5U1_9ACTN
MARPLRPVAVVQVTAQAGGGPLTVPSPETCEYTARQLAGEADADFQDDGAYELAWATMLRLLDRVAPDYRD